MRDKTYNDQHTYIAPYAYAKTLHEVLQRTNNLEELAKEVHRDVEFLGIYTEFYAKTNVHHATIMDALLRNQEKFRIHTLDNEKLKKILMVLYNYA